MKAALIVLIAAHVAAAQTSVVIVPRPPANSVVSPLTPPTAAANQSLLNQISATQSQRAIQHQILTTSPLLSSPATPVITGPTTIQTVRPR